MRFDWTITLGTVVQIVVFLAAFVWGAVKIYTEHREMRIKVDALWTVFVGDGTEERPGVEQRIHHAVRGAINDDVWLKELARRVMLR